MYESFLGVNPWTALFVLLNTLTIFFVAKKYLFGPVITVIENRREEIEGMYSDAHAARENALTLEEQYKNQLSAAAQTGERIVSEAVARSASREQEILRTANREAAAILERASQRIALEQKQALQAAKEEISVIALSMAEKVVGRQLRAGDQRNLIDEFLDELGDTP